MLLFVFNLDSTPYINMNSAFHSGMPPVIEPTLRLGVIRFRVAKTSCILCVLFVWEWLPGFCTCCVMHGGTCIGYLVVVQANRPYDHVNLFHAAAYIRL